MCISDFPWRTPTPVLTKNRSGGTNLRVGFIELVGHDLSNGHCNGNAKPHLNGNSHPGERIRRLFEKSWPISNHLKNQNAQSLFEWIGDCIAQVVESARKDLEIPNNVKLPLGVTFSFPAQQSSLSQASVTSMGKGFAISQGADLGRCIQEGYAKFKTPELPEIEVTAIANDSVSTLVSFIFNFDASQRRRASMGLILGTGSNATVPLKLSRLHPSKWPKNVSVLDGEKVDDARIAVNTEWSINGTESPMRELGLISKWDDILSAQNERPGFQPLEYMTAGRYLGELGRLMLVDYLTIALSIPQDTLPEKILQPGALTTTFLSHFKPLEATTLLASLQAEIPASGQFSWTEQHAEALYYIAKAIEYRAAGIIAAASIALLTLAEELPESAADQVTEPSADLGVGYTGGCIVHFQDYLKDCQQFLDDILALKFDGAPPAKVILSPCHDGGISGAGILAAAAISSSEAGTA